MTKSRFYIFLYLIISGVLHAQNIKFKRISNDDGLSTITVQSIIQDSEDFVWIGTQDGLNRYDGYHFKTFKNNPHAQNSISSNDINCIYEDKSGVLYIGTKNGGLSVFDKYRETFTNYKSGLSTSSISSNDINSLTDLSDGKLLLGTANGLNIFDKKTRKFEQVTARGIDESFEIRALLKDSRKNIWAASNGFGLLRLDESTGKLIAQSLPENLGGSNGSLEMGERNNIRTLIEVNNQLWCGTDGGGILIYDLNTNTFTDVVDFGQQQRYNNRITSFMLDSDPAYMWIGTWGGLIHLHINSRAYTMFKKNDYDFNSLSDNKVSCLMQDKQKNMWIGTQDNGISIYFTSQTKFPHFNQYNGLTNDFIYSLLETNDRTIWVGANEGLYSFNPKTNTFRDESAILNKFQAKSVLTLLEDSRGNLWIGTYGQGVIMYNRATKTFKKLLADANLGGSVMKIIESKNGTIWVGTYEDGLYSINPNTFAIHRYTTAEGLSSNNIYSIYENASDNTLWLSTEGGGVCILDFITNSEKPFITVYKHQDNKNSLSSNTVNSVFRDKKGIFWIATTNGLNKFDPKTKQFDLYTENDGLPNNYVYDIIPDKTGCLWLPTNIGLSRFNPDVENNNGSAFRNYNTKDGIQGREFNQGASFLCHDGKILVGGVSGFNYFDPAEIRENKITPNSYIYSYSRQGKEIASDTCILFKKHLDLTHRENYFTFELITLDYIDPDKNKFMYKLEGYDNDWSSPSNVRYVTYTELPGGTYTFKVKATNNDGIWNEVPYQITITVIPPWWKTTWFYIIATLLTGGIVFGIFTYRTNAIKKENKILENKVAERTKELAEKNRDITSSIEYAKRIQEAILPSKDLIYSKLKNAFILYKPKDIVSGDFYWFGERNNVKIIAVVDCTGHGVPGAFMSMIGHNLLNQIVSEKGFSDPGQILSELHKGVQAALKQGAINEIKTNDGMDVSILAINTDTNEIAWAGAFRSLVIVNADGELEKTEGNKYPVGGAQLDVERVFTTHRKALSKNDMIYMFSDGYADQFGGDKGKKFMVKKFHEVLVNIHQYSMTEQHNQLLTYFENWRGNYEQVDDVLVVGIKI
ncbi:MAG: SpoIIE family protein phosphatase [Bacteroidetes bacterium]|nr:SpoIIE family protein phosphatase [Bacteroidota bacterium]